MNKETEWGYTEQRPLFDWVIFGLIYIILISAIGYAALSIYGSQLGWWVAGSAAIAGLVCLYLFHVEVARETGYKILLAVCVAANAGWLVHNGALAIGTKEFNDAQLKKFEIGMKEARQARTARDRHALSVTAAASAKIEKLFAGDMSTVAALLAFCELVSALIIFADATSQARRYQRQEARERRKRRAAPAEPDEEEEWPEEVAGAQHPNG